MNLTIKKVPAKSVLCSTHELTIKDIPAIAEQIIPQLFAEAEGLELEVAGPIEFLYRGLDGKPGTSLELTIMLPIKKQKKATQNHQFTQTRTKAIRCASAEHTGSMETIRITYSALFHTVHEEGLKTTDEVREIYHKWISYYSPFNVTEIQIGLA